MNHDDFERRDFLKLAGMGGLVFASALGGCSRTAASARSAAVTRDAASARARTAGPDFFFLQLSDTHWGFEGPPNPEAATCLEQTVRAINAVETQPDFIVFTGDLTHKTDDARERRARLSAFHDIVGGLRTRALVFLPGEHDAAADEGAAYRERFGDLYRAFEHGGVHFVTLDNASAPGGALGETQLAWLDAEVRRVPAGAPLVVLAHRPLFELYPAWEWTTADGARALDILGRHDNVTVFYGHIHQEHHHLTGGIAHHSARSLMFPLPAPGSVAKRNPLPWDPASEDHGLGHRRVELRRGRTTFVEVPFVDHAVTASMMPAPARAAARAPAPATAAEASTQRATPAACTGVTPSYANDVRPVLERRCFGCHTGSGAAADEHDFASPDQVLAERAAIGRNVRAHTMPPPRAPRLSDDELATLVRFATCGGS